MISYFARFQPDEGRRQVVGPRAEGIIYLRGFCGPLHYGTRRNGRIWHAGQSTRQINAAVQYASEGARPCQPACISSRGRERGGWAWLRSSPSASLVVWFQRLGGWVSALVISCNVNL